MAAELRIKVSEDKVKEAVQTLQRKIESMQGHLDQLIANREKLDKIYTGPTASIAISAIKKREKEAKNSIEKFTAQKEKLQAYLDSMNTTDTKVAQNYEAALNKSNELFK